MPEKYSLGEAKLEASLLETRRDQFGESYPDAEGHVDKDTKIVIDILKEAKERIETRKKLIVNTQKEEKLKQMKDLRKVMFERKEEGEAFHELSDEELALLEDQIEVYIEEGRLRVVDTDVEDLVRSYRVIRHDLLTGREEITPEQFREASNQITETIFKDIYNDDNLDPDKTVVLMPWRAGLAFGEAATKNKRCS